MELLIGMLAGLFTSVSMIPQVYKVIKNKDVESISWVMVTILLIGVTLWVIYGIMKNEYPIIIFNAFSMLINSILLICYFSFKDKSKSS